MLILTSCTASNLQSLGSHSDPTLDQVYDVALIALSEFGRHSLIAKILEKSLISVKLNKRIILENTINLFCFYQ